MYIRVSALSRAQPINFLVSVKKEKVFSRAGSRQEHAQINPRFKSLTYLTVLVLTLVSRKYNF